MTDAPLVPGAVNFRDVGGLPAGSGRTRDGVLYRSGNLAQLDAHGLAEIERLAIRRVIDLRADDQRAHAPSRTEALGLTTQHVPLFLGSVASFFERDMSLAEMYRALVDDSAASVVEAVRGLLAEQPVLIHCTVGKDRTGVTVALALAAAGVDQDAVVADYARTEALLPEWRNREVVRQLRLLHPEAVHLEELASRSPASVMRALLDDLTSRFGSPADYLRAHGLAEDEIVELRRVLVAAD
ncbi:MAG: tyrosine-protein phosphatase [Microbacterium sp.]|nr:tyrosine-protein phosphatase [Microbacterium sp.]